MSIDFAVKDVIEQKIAELAREYKQTQGLILTEDDLKCLIYFKLMQIPELSQRVGTKDQQVYANSIHSEVSWFDKEGKLSIIPDLTILEPEHLSILKRNDNNLQLPCRLPSKQFIAYGRAIIFELKFIRNKTGITPRAYSGAILKDYKKIEGLFEKLNTQGTSDDVFCFFIIFNKTDIKCKEFNDFLKQNIQSERHKIIYATGNVSFDRGRPNR